jgi:hypothetical protein
MADLCVAAAPSVTVAARVAAQRQRNEPVVPTNPKSEDELLACLLISTWSVLTGRTLRAAAPADLTAEELIEFWADDFPENSPKDSPADARFERPAASGR